MKKVWRVEFEVEAEKKEDVERLFYKVVDSDKATIYSEDYVDTSEELKARIGYNKKEDSFDLLISTDGGDTWGLCVSSKCRLSINNKAGDEPEFIHCGLISELKNAIRLGYRIVY